MQKIEIAKGFDFSPKKLPQSWVFYAISCGDELLYSGFSARLSQKLYGLRLRQKEDPLIAEMGEKADNILVETCENGLEALARAKSFLTNESPRYQYRIQPWQDYVYLALDAYRFPFVSIQSSTNDDWQYIGPFRSRFILVDLMDTLARILKLPHCETGTFPCEKLQQERCRGWCLDLSEDKDNKREYDLDKLDSLLKEAFLHPNNGIYELVKNQRDEYFNNLDFLKADLLDDELKLLGDYRDWLNFLYVAKDLAYESDEYSIAQGQLTQAKVDGKSYSFIADTTQYRENEKLALPLAKVDEMKIVYDFIKEKSNA